MANGSTTHTRTLEVLYKHRIASTLAVLLMMSLILISLPNRSDTISGLWAHMRVALRNWIHQTPSLRHDYFYHCGLADAVSEASHGLPMAWSGHDEIGILSNCDSSGGTGDIQGTTCQDFPAPAFGSSSMMNISGHDCLTYASRYVSACSRMPRDMEDSRVQTTTDENQSRTAIVLRAWDGFKWTLDDIINTRAIVAEVDSLADSGYLIHILLHIKEGPQAQLRSVDIPRDVALDSIPNEFRHIAEYWTYADCEHAYEAVAEYDVFHHTFMSLQIFADRHPEYDHFWNWEMDVRYTGVYSELFLKLAAWTRDQPVEQLWERNTRFYLESYHESYENFTRSIVSSLPQPAPWIGNQIQPPSSAEADLITLFPMFDVAHTNWFHKDYLVGYKKDEVLPRFGTVGTNMRLSKGLLQLMADENRRGRTMMSEMWPPTLAFHHGLKTVYAPHPIFTKTQWSAADLQQKFNGGKDGRVGGAWTSVMNHEADFLEMTWFWNADFAGELYTRWMGVASDGPGSAEWRRTHGPMCLPPMLLHPVKASKLQGVT